MGKETYTARLVRINSQLESSGVKFDITTTLLSMLETEITALDTREIQKNWQSWINQQDCSKRVTVIQELLDGNRGVLKPGLIECFGKDFTKETYTGLELPTGCSLGCLRIGLWRVQSIQHNQTRSTVILGMYDSSDKGHHETAHKKFIGKKLCLPAVQAWLAQCNSYLEASSGGGASIEAAQEAAHRSAIAKWSEDYLLVKQRRIDTSNHLGNMAKFYATILAEASHFRSSVFNEKIVKTAAEFMVEHAIYFTREGLLFQCPRDGRPPLSHKLKIGSRHAVRLNIRPKILHELYAHSQEATGQVAETASRDVISEFVKMQAVLLLEPELFWQRYLKHVKLIDGQGKLELIIQQILSCPKMVQDEILKGYCKQLRGMDQVKQQQICQILYGCIVNLQGGAKVARAPKAGKRFKEASRLEVVEKLKLVEAAKAANWLDADSCREVSDMIFQNNATSNCTSAKKTNWGWVLVTRFNSGQLKGGFFKLHKIAFVDPGLLLEYADVHREVLPISVIVNLFTLGAKIDYNEIYHKDLFQWISDSDQLDRFITDLRNSGNKYKVGSVGSTFLKVNDSLNDVIDQQLKKFSQATNESPKHRHPTKKQSKPERRRRRKKVAKISKTPLTIKEIIELLKLENALNQIALDPRIRPGLKEAFRSISTSNAVWYSKEQIREMRTLAKKGHDILKRVTLDGLDSRDRQHLLKLLFATSRPKQPVLNILTLLLATEAHEDDKKSTVQAWIKYVLVLAKANTDTTTESSACKSGGQEKPQVKAMVGSQQIQKSSIIVDYLRLVSSFPNAVVNLDIVMYLIGEGFSPGVAGDGGYNAATVAAFLGSKKIVKNLKTKSMKGGSGRNSLVGGCKSPAAVLMEMIMCTGDIDLCAPSHVPSLITSPLIISPILVAMVKNNMDLFRVLLPFLPPSAMFTHPLTGVTFTIYDAATDKFRAILKGREYSYAGRTPLVETEEAQIAVEKYMLESADQQILGQVYRYLCIKIKHQMAANASVREDLNESLTSSYKTALFYWEKAKVGIERGHCSVGEVHSGVCLGWVACAVVMGDDQYLLKLLDRVGVPNVGILFNLGATESESIGVGNEWNCLFDLLTPLHIAALLGETKCLEVLLNHGAKSIASKHGLFAFDMLLLPYLNKMGEMNKENIEASLKEALGPEDSILQKHLANMMGEGRLSQDGWRDELNFRKRARELYIRLCKVRQLFNDQKKLGRAQFPFELCKKVAKQSDSLNPRDRRFCFDVQYAYCELIAGKIQDIARVKALRQQGGSRALLTTRGRILAGIDRRERRRSLPRAYHWLPEGLKSMFEKMDRRYERQKIMFEKIDRDLERTLKQQASAPESDRSAVGQNSFSPGYKGIDSRDVRYPDTDSFNSDSSSDGNVEAKPHV